MKLPFFSILALIVLLNPLWITAQPASDSGLRNVQPDTNGEAKINQITNDAGIYFKSGLLNLQDSRRASARLDFDKAVEVFLLANINVKTNNKLNNCYNQLIETIYRIEFPSPAQPNIRGLADTCGWKIDSKLADDVARLTQNSPRETFANNGGLRTSVSNKEQSVETQVGFVDQNYLPSSQDDLAQLDLSTDDYLKSLFLMSSKDNQSARTKNCQTSLSPTIRNIQLGMTTNEVEKVLKTKLSIQKSELSSVGVSFANAPKVSGVYQLYLNFLDGRVSWLKVIYDKSIKWSGIAEFQNKVSDALVLPTFWKSDSDKNESRLVCKNFSLKITELSVNFKTYMLETASLKSTQIIESRLREKELERQRNEQKKKETFKP